MGIAFGNDPENLGAITAILVLQIVVGLVVASSWAKDEPPVDAAVDTAAAAAW